MLTEEYLTQMEAELWAEQCEEAEDVAGWYWDNAEA